VTGDVSPSGQPGDAVPELRASHEDRDRVVEILRVAAGDGRLTAEELDERLEAALTARTYGELAVLTADLPAAAGPSGAAAAKPKEVVRISHRGGSARRAGPWVVPKRMEIEVVGGNVRLDFTQAVITEPTLQIDASVRGGNFVIVTRPGVVVETDDMTMVGGNVIDRSARAEPAPVVLTIQLEGTIRGGNVRIGPPRPPRRSFWEWLLRRPRPVSRALPPSRPMP
jgi:Domain of unknown function (DUF1707)